MRLVMAILAWLSPLFAVGAAQGQTGEMAKPTTLHVEMVRDSIASGTYTISGSTNGCPTASVEVAGWPRHLLRECEYSAHGLNGFVYLLDIEPARIATWIESGCGKFVAEHVARLPKADRKFADDATYRRECFRVALELARLNSGMMFPIAGSIIENMGKGPGHYAFRQGTTVSIKCQTDCAPRCEGKCNSSVPVYENGVRSSGRPVEDNTMLPIAEQRRRALLGDAEIASIANSGTRFWNCKSAVFADRFVSSSAPRTLGTAEDRVAWLRISREAMAAALKSADNALLECWLFGHKEKIRSVIERRTVVLKEDMP